MTNKTNTAIMHLLKQVGLLMVIFYICMLIGSAIQVYEYNTSHQDIFGGFQFFPTLLFMIAIGAVMPYRYFVELNSNGISRKSIAVSLIVSGVAMSLISAFADRVIEYILFDYIRITPLYNILFVYANGETGFTVSAFLSGMLFYMTLYLATYTFATVLGLLYHKFSSIIRIASTVGTAAILILLTFIVDFKSVADIIYAVAGINEANPFIGVATFSCIAVVCTVIASVLVKKTEQNHASYLVQSAMHG